MRQEVIVYRSPAEAALWDVITSPAGSNIVVWLICAAGVGLFLHVMLSSIRREPRWLQTRWGVTVFVILDATLLFFIVKWALTYL